MTRGYGNAVKMTGRGRDAMMRRMNNFVSVSPNPPVTVAEFKGGIECSE